jgi:hypothetical protein
MEEAVEAWTEENGCHFIPSTLIFFSLSSKGVRGSHGKIDFVASGAPHHLHRHRTEHGFDEGSIQVQNNLMFREVAAGKAEGEKKVKEEGKERERKGA